MTYQVNKEFLLGANEGDSRLAQNLYIIAHDTANPRATGRNEATYMKNNWSNAYTTHVVGDGIVYQIGEPGYISWGALNANPYASAQIELQSTPDKALFKKNYAVYIALIRDLAKQFGIPLTLDAGGVGTKGVKTHQWVTNNYGGDHTDPYGYLASMGISREQFAKDIVNGIGSFSAQAVIPKPQQSNNKNGIAIDNITRDQATKVVQRIQSKYAWTLLRDQVKANKQKDGRYTLTIKTGKGNRLNQSLARLKQELKTYQPGYMQQNIVIVDGDKDSARIEARNMSVDFSSHMRNFLKDILLDGQTYAEKNTYGTYDVRVKGEGFNNTDAPIALKEIQAMGNAKDVKINQGHIKGFKY